MRLFFCITVIILSTQSNAQQGDLSSRSMLRLLGEGDSLTYYQCYVSGRHPLKATTQSVTVTEKLVLQKKAGVIRGTFYYSNDTAFPNRRFSGLKIRERPYWLFSSQRTFELSEKDLQRLDLLERSGREAIEYDYPVTKYTTNQLIIRQRKNFRQLVITGNSRLSAMFLKDQ